MKNQRVQVCRKHELPQGFGLLELLAVIALAAVIIPSMLQFSFSVTKVINRELRQVEAAYLAQEGIEAVRTMRDRSWGTTIAPLAIATPYYPVITSNNWTLSLSNPGVLQGRYTRTVTLSAVSRDASSSDIVAAGGGGVEDGETRLITSTVTWSEAGVERNVTLKAYLTNFLAN